MLQTELRGNAGNKIALGTILLLGITLKLNLVQLYSVLVIVLQIAVLTSSEKKDAEWAQKQGMERDGSGGVAG